MYEINSREIEKKYPKVRVILEKENDIYKDSDKVEIKRSAEEEEIVYVWHNAYCYPLNSRYQAKKAAEEWATQYATTGFEDAFFVFGLANGMYLQALLDRMNKSAHVLVYEPDAAIFYKVLNEIDCHKMLRDERVTVAGGSEQLAIVVEWLGSRVTYMNYKKVHMCPVPNYLQLYRKEWEQYVQLVSHHLEVVDSSVYSELKFGKEFQENILHNIGDVIFQSSINQLKEKFKECDTKNIPVIIVSAGPSLDKNVKHLKEAQGKAFIVVVDTALKAVLREGIIPDLSITADPHKPESLFEHKDVQDIPFLYCKYSNWRLHDKLNGRRFYSGHGEDFIGAVHCLMNGEMIDNIDSGGSVAHEGFSLAVYLGFKKIILIGQDLAYPEGKGHTKDAYDGEDDIAEKENLLWVEDIYGNQVITEPNMDMYRKWFEKQIARYQSSLQVIDATEGGAKIAGTKIMTLREAMEQECTKDWDFKKMIQEIPPAYNNEQREQIVAYFHELPSILQKMKGEIDTGIREYEELRKYNRGEMQDVNRYKQLIESIGVRNQWIESQGEMELVSMYNKEEEYQIQENVYQNQSQGADEVEGIINDGIFMLKSYLKGIDKLTEQWDVCLEEVHKRMSSDMH